MTERSISAAMPYESKFVDVEGARIHYVEEGTGDPILFLHGNPTSCYLWRNVMPHLASDARCLAMDLVGMGRSDKPALDYRLVDHARYVDKFIAALGLERLTLVLHDWGSALGFHYARRHEANVKGVAFMEAIVRALAERDSGRREAGGRRRPRRRVLGLARRLLRAEAAAARATGGHSAQGSRGLVPGTREEPDDCRRRPRTALHPGGPAARDRRRGQDVVSRPGRLEVLGGTRAVAGRAQGDARVTAPARSRAPARTPRGSPQLSGSGSGRAGG